MWHAVQLVRKNWPPRTIDSLLGAGRVVVRLVRDRRAGAERGDVRREGADLLRGVDDLLALGLDARAGHRHPAGADLEVDRGGADAGQRRAVLRAALGDDALAVLAVAGGAADEEQRAALGDAWTGRPRWSRRWRGRARRTGRRSPAGPSAGRRARRTGCAAWLRVGRRGVALGVLWSVPGRWSRWRAALLDQVDRREQTDPDDVDEVPVVRHDDGADGLLVGELPGHVGAAEDEQEGDQPAGDVQAVEAGGEVEDRAVRRGRGSWCPRGSARCTPAPGRR